MAAEQQPGLPAKDFVFHRANSDFEVDFTPEPYRSFELPYRFSPDQLSVDAFEVETVGNILEMMHMLDADPEWIKSAQESFLWILHSFSLQSLGAKKQLGLITTPENVFLSEMTSFINRRAGELHIESGPAKYSENKPDYIGGSRRQHALTTAEFGGRAGIKMGLSGKEWYANMVAHLLHDSGQSALSHVGEQTLEIALKIPQVQTRLEKIGIGKISPSHEERSAEIAGSAEVARNLLAVGVDPEMVSDIIRNEHYGLGIFDSLAYLFRDNQNIAKHVEDLAPFPEGLVDEIINSIQGVNPDTKIVKIGEAGIGALERVLEVRLEAYRRVYTNPETLKIESMVVDVLTQMLIDGVINIQDFIVQGTDDSIRVNAVEVARRDKRYHHLITALDGDTLSNTRAVNPTLLSKDMSALNLYDLKRRVMARVLEERGRELPEDSFYVVPPYDPTGKQFEVEVEGERRIIRTNKGKDVKAHPQQGQLIIIAEDTLSEGALDDIEESLTGNPGSDESLYQYNILQPKIVPILQELETPLSSRYNVEVEKVKTKGKKIWESGGLSFVRVAEKRVGGREAEFVIEARFAQPLIDTGNKVDRDTVVKVISQEEFLKLIHGNGEAVDMLLADDNIPEAVRERLESAKLELLSDDSHGRIETVDETVYKLKREDKGDVGKIVVTTADEGVLKSGEVRSLPSSLPNTLSIIVGKHASSYDTANLKKLFDSFEGVVAVTE